MIETQESIDTRFLEIIQGDFKEPECTSDHTYFGDTCSVKAVARVLFSCGRSPVLVCTKALIRVTTRSMADPNRTCLYCTVRKCRDCWKVEPL